MIPNAESNCGIFSEFGALSKVGQRKMSLVGNGNEFLHNTDSAFVSVKTPGKDSDYLMRDAGGFGASHIHRDSDFCGQCFESSAAGNAAAAAAAAAQDNLLNSVRSYDMSSANISNMNNISTRNLIRTSGLTSNPWSLIDPASHVSTIQPHDLRSHSNLGNYGLKLHNSLLQLDNLSNIQNMSSIANNYSPFSSLYSTVGQGHHYGGTMVPPRVDHGVSGPAYSWTAARGNGFLSSRCSETGLFMPPYRKPKRIRTAFSPTQLLRLEHAFEKNHYVVGQERKDLSASLNLSETQVKVWFQNRRTKHKRVQVEEEMSRSFSRRCHGNKDPHTPSLEDVIIDA